MWFSSFIRSSVSSSSVLISHCPALFLSLSPTVAHRLLRGPHDDSSASNVDNLPGAKRAVFDENDLIYLAYLGTGCTYPSLPLLSIFSPAHSLLPFNSPMPDDVSLIDPSFRLVRILARLVPLPDAIKLLNNWVRLGHCSLSLQH